MLLRYALGEEKAAQRIEAAVMGALDKGYRTGDIMSPGKVSIKLFLRHPLCNCTYVHDCSVVSYYLPCLPFKSLMKVLELSALTLPFPFHVCIRSWWAARKWERSCSKLLKHLYRPPFCTEV